MLTALVIGRRVAGARRRHYTQHDPSAQVPSTGRSEGKVRTYRPRDPHLHRDHELGIPTVLKGIGVAAGVALLSLYGFELWPLWNRLLLNLGLGIGGWYPGDERLRLL